VECLYAQQELPLVEDVALGILVVIMTEQNNELEGIVAACKTEKNVGWRQCEWLSRITGYSLSKYGKDSHLKTWPVICNLMNKIMHFSLHFAWKSSKAWLHLAFSKLTFADLP
jgi:hypothetical protein